MSQKSDSSYNSSGYSTSENESDEESYDVSNLCEDFKKLKPYDYEPAASSWSQTVKFQMIPVKVRNHGVNARNARLCKGNEKVVVVKRLMRYQKIYSKV